MATCSRLCFYLFLVALLPMFASCIRPFRVPKNLFVHGTSPFTLPEGAHEIRREGEESLETSAEELVEDVRGRMRSRFRRESPSIRPIPPPQPEKSNQSLAQSFDTLFMYWPRNGGSEKYVFLLAKNTKKGSNQSVSKVYVSSNYGKNFTALGLTSNNKAALINQIYSSKANPKLCILADKVNKVLYRSDDLKNFQPRPVIFEPSYITFHPSDPAYAMAYDSPKETLYWSNDGGKNFHIILGKVKSFHWGMEGIHNTDRIFVEMFSTVRKDNRTTIYQLANGQTLGSSIVANVEEFEVMKNYMFITTRKNPADKNPVLKVAKITKDQAITFEEAQFPLNEESRDFFVFDVVEDFVFVVINHQRNMSNMYLSDTNGVKYQLSLPRVLYHNPYTDVSSPWLRTVIPYAFVDVDKIKGIRSIYIATQLTPGPVGKRHLLSLITYNRGGKWQRLRSPTVDIRGVRINCYLPGCSLHLNLLYGAVYRVSPSDRLFSSKSVPGLVLGSGVASTNLKIYPDLFMSLDGGLGWSRVLRGKYLFTFGDHGGVIIAVPYRRYTRSLRYSINGGAKWEMFTFSSSSVLARDVVTQPGERLPVFLIYGTISGQPGTWKVFYLNMTSVLGQVCDSSGLTTWTEGCLLGRQQQFETRNWTVPCHMGRDYNRAIDVRNCTCTRDDFQCDYGFQRKAFDEECTPIRQGADLDHGIIPDSCTEGTNYSRTQGFRRIPGDSCENGTEKDFLPVSTPCPVKELMNLTLNSNNLKDGTPAIVTGTNASFVAKVAKGYYPNINFKWFFGDGHDETGRGKEFANQQHNYNKPGKYVVSVVASNTRSILVAKLELYVQEQLDGNRVTINFKPEDPGVNDKVIFSVNLNYSNVEVGNVHYKWKYDDGEKQGWQPVVSLEFKSAKTYNVSITAKNYVSTVKKTAQVQVFKDLKPVKVIARVLGPSKVLVQWNPPAHADGTISVYKVYQSTTGIDGFTESTCEATTMSSCKVSNLTPATTYYFKVQASTTNGDIGPFSDFAVATTNASVPGAPTELRVYPVNSTVIRVVWKAPANPNGKITSYKIQYWSNINSQVTNVSVNSNKLSKDITGLSQDTYYFFEVYAKSTTGRSIAAGPKQALTRLSKPTQKPREVHKVSDNGTCAMLMWKAPYLSAVDERAFPAKGYKVQVNSNSPIDTPTTYAIVCQLQPGKSYDVKVWAYSEAGRGPSATIQLKTQTIKPGTPQNVRCRTPRSTKQVTLEWDSPVQSSSGVTGYEIYQSNPYKDQPYTVGAYKTSYTIDKLLPFTSYVFSISAKNSLGLSVKSSPVRCSTSEDSPGVVQYVTAESIKPKSATIKITWSTPNKPNGVIRQYKIKWGKVVVVVGPSTRELTVDGSTSAYTFKNLASSTSYSFVVIPINNAGEGLQHIKPVSERTYPAMKNTERLQLDYDGPRMDGEDARDFIPKFINVANTKAGIVDVRLAAVAVKDGFKVLFDLLPPLNATGVPMEKAKAALNEGFRVMDWKLIAGSLKRVFVYDGTDAISPSPAGQPSHAAQRGGGSNDSSSSNKTYLAIAVPLAIIGIALLGGMIFFYLKYKSVEKNYRNMGNQHHEGEDMKVIYNEEMQADSPDVIFSDRSRKGKKLYKDSEKVPLGDSDELAMI